MKRREFMALIGGAVAMPLLAQAQQPQRVWRIGSLPPGRRPANEPLKAFTGELSELGYIGGKNTHFERRVADGALDQLPALAAELIRAKVDVILAKSSFAVEAARQATTTIPIVMTGVGNPIGSGFVKSVSRPAATSPASPTFPLRLAASIWSSCSQ